eukprot:6874749-Lingulodinium_polyedra.AAC.1
MPNGAPFFWRGVFALPLALLSVRGEVCKPGQSKGRFVNVFAHGHVCPRIPLGNQLSDPDQCAGHVHAGDFGAPNATHWLGGRAFEWHLAPVPEFALLCGVNGFGACANCGTDGDGIGAGAGG